MGAAKKVEKLIGADAFADLCARRENIPGLDGLRIETCTFSEAERNVASTLGTRYATFAEPSALANFLAFLSLTAPALGERAIARGDEMIVVSAKAPVGIDAMTAFGVQPIFVNLPYPQCHIDESVLENALSMQTRAVLLSHDANMTFDLKTVRNFCNKYELWLIEDSLDVYGAAYDFDGTVYRTGTVGDIGTVSVPEAPYGAVLTNNETLCAIAHVLRGSGETAHG